MIILSLLVCICLQKNRIAFIINVIFIDVNIKKKVGLTMENTNTIEILKVIDKEIKTALSNGEGTTNHSVKIKFQDVKKVYVEELGENLYVSTTNPFSDEEIKNMNVVIGTIDFSIKTISGLLIEANSYEIVPHGALVSIDFNDIIDISMQN